MKHFLITILTLSCLAFANSPPPNFKLEAEDGICGCDSRIVNQYEASNHKYMDMQEDGNLKIYFSPYISGWYNYDLAIKVPSGTRKMSAWINGTFIKTHQTKSKTWIIKTTDAPIYIDSDMNNLFELRDDQCTAEFDVDYIFFKILEGAPPSP